MQIGTYSLPNVPHGIIAASPQDAWDMQIVAYYAPRLKERVVT